MTELFLLPGVCFNLNISSKAPGDVRQSTRNAQVLLLFSNQSIHLQRRTVHFYYLGKEELGNLRDQFYAVDVDKSGTNVVAFASAVDAFLFLFANKELEEALQAGYEEIDFQGLLSTGSFGASFCFRASTWEAEVSSSCTNQSNCIIKSPPAPEASKSSKGKRKVSTDDAKAATTVPSEKVKTKK
ncbi:hypothetical protein POM88_038605 [Heracleum sosnowskyi]|uniref:Uncharacterized protein n=1 Tax=Heracleum sosnowskyi TaxID=360622 RepID=A0AAD8HAZ8_9APIA|nr:hypothetical protein POM88_038605 [Heracleum sosnowskyi]